LEKYFGQLTIPEMNETVTGYSLNQEVIERAEMDRVLEGLDQAPIIRTKAGARHVLRVAVERQAVRDESHTQKHEGECTQVVRSIVQRTRQPLGCVALALVVAVYSARRRGCGTG
jgi:hypothetical protein